MKTFLSRVCENLDYCWLTYIENSLSPLLPFYKSFPIFQKALNQFTPHNIMHTEYLGKNLSLGLSVTDSAKYYTSLEKKKTKKQTGTTCDGMQMYGFWLVIQLYAWLVNLSLSPSCVLLLYSSDIFFVLWFCHDPSKFLPCGWIFNDICELRGKRSVQRGWLDYLVNLHQLCRACNLGHIAYLDRFPTFQ